MGVRPNDKIENSMKTPREKGVTPRYLKFTNFHKSGKMKKIGGGTT